MKTILISRDVSDNCASALKNMGYNILKLTPFSKLQTAVSCHADMLLFYDGKELLTHKDYYTLNKETFDSLNVKIVLSDENISSEYPNDILFNAVLMSDGTLFSKALNTSKYITEKAKKIIPVKQGYAACSVCMVSESACLTTDKGLYDAFIKNGIDSLLVEKKGIDLPGYDCGFIGGASVVLDDKICFFGDLSKHSDYEKIVAFADRYGKSVLSLSDEDLTDLGGAVVI